MTTTTWNGNAMSQNDMMLKDTVLVLDNDDTIIGSASKKESHVFSATQSRGVLHRAFSVFLFDESNGKLLLQQRASTKITFPKVWTNTCCSHPLHGMEPSEVDTSCADGKVLGVKNAAIRKLDHELGIPSSELDIHKFQFLTRLHYWAADTVTHGNKSPWGEHEIDYVLFYTIPNKDALTIKGHPDEVDDVKWVSQEELQIMFDDSSLLFSPWFRLICQRWMVGPDGWWSNLKESMSPKSKYMDYTTIHRFDPPTEHLGGGGNAGLQFGDDGEKSAAAGDASKKQGAYGKIKTHKESKLAQISHLDEVWSAITLLYLKPLVSNLDTDYIKETFTTDELQFCDFILGKVSRSFAAVIRQLPKQLLVDIMIFYLVLRALDTIEDDTTAFKSHADKILKLKEFHKFALVDSTWTLDGVGEGDERRLLQEFPKCQAIFSKLKEPSRKVISDITERMADGMAEFVDKDMGQGTVDVTQYNRYCHFVAGLVGEGLSRLFAASGLETASFAGELILSDQMGLFLQKVNIIRDYLEDYVDGRAWWPQTVWKKYSKTGDLGYFSDQDDPEAAKQALYCLNELVSDALELAPSCLAYMSKLQCIEVFRFCAIPQVMAIATLDKLYSNPKVFTGVVKIRKGMSCKLILQTNTLPELHAIFYEFANSILQKARRERNRGVVDPSFDRTVKACDAIVELTETTRLRKSSGNLIFRFLVLVVGFHVVKYTSPPEWFKSLHEPADNILRGIALIIGSIVFLQNTAKGKSNLKTADAILGGK